MQIRNTYTPKHEPYQVSCRVLDYFIKTEKDARKKELYVCDLLHKAEGLNGDQLKFKALSKGFAEFLPARPHSIFSASMNKNTYTPPIEVEVAIVTIKRPELYAATLAFDINLDTFKPKIARDYYYYEGNFTNVRDQAKDSFVITVAGNDRNVACSNCVQTLLRVYKPKLCVLIGMAAGNCEMTKFGDVVIAEEVIDYEGGRMEVGRVVKRPKYFEIGRIIRTQLTDFNQEDGSWRDDFSRGVEIINARGKVPQDMPPNWLPNVKPSVVLSGEKLRADGAMESLRLDYHDKAYALDMEASGFVQACQAENVPWMVFRGISDYGDPESKDGIVKNDPTRKYWQPYASFAAASVAKAFLTTRWRSAEF